MPPSARKYIDFAPSANLTGAINSTVTTFSVDSAVGFPTSRPYFAVLDIGTSSAEIISVTNVSANVVTCVRNANGLGAFSHTGTPTLTHVAVALDFQEANDHVTATSGVHGRTGTLVGTTDVQTLTNKTLTAPVLTSATTDKLTATGAILSNNLRTQVTFADGTNVSEGVAGGPFLTTLGLSSTATIDVDTLGAYVTSTGTFVVPAGMSGTYHIQAAVLLNSSNSAGSVALYKNGAILRDFLASPTLGTAVNFTLEGKESTLTAGDQLLWKVRQLAAAGPPTCTVISTSGQSYFRIERRS